MKLKIFIFGISLLLWVLLVLFHLFWYVKNGLVVAMDGYDRSWQFQVFAFGITTLPYYLIGFCFFLIIELSLLSLIDSKKN